MNENHPNHGISKDKEENYYEQIVISEDWNLNHNYEYIATGPGTIEKHIGKAKACV